MGKQADELVLSMNRAAEAAVPEAKALLVNAVKEMSVEDAKGILTGGDQAATDFFRKKTETALTEKFLPMVKTATGQVGLAQTYNKYAGLASKFKMVKEDQASIENYVTKQSLDRLYKVIGEQERAIRTNPIQYGSELLKKVFGAVMGK
jgi:enolase